MRLLFRVAIVLVLSLVALTLPGASAQAADGDVYVSPHHAVPSEEVTVRGSNFTAEARVYVYYYPDGDRIQLGRVETDEN